MKKAFFTLIFCVSIVSAVNGQFTKVGGGLGLTSGYYFHEAKLDYNKSGNILGSLKGIYEFSLPFHVSPSLSFFVPHIIKDGDARYSVNTAMIDINGHYVFNSLDQFEFYGLAGLDILMAWKKEKYFENVYKEKDNALGLNLGVGTYMKIRDSFDLYAEAKYLFNNKYNQLMLNAGILFNIEWMAKNEKNGGL